MIGRWGHVRAVLRIARRDALRAKGRTALVAVMIGLPVLAVSTTAVVARSGQLDPADRVAVELGAAAQALVRVEGDVPVRQDPALGALDTPLGLDGGPPQVVGPLTVPAARQRIEAALPPRDELTASREGPLDLRVGDRAVDAAGLEVDLAQPGLGGLYPLEEGRFAGEPGEVVVTTALARHAALAVGDTFGLASAGTSKRQVEVVGIVLDTRFRPLVLAGPEALFGPVALQEPVVGALRTQWYVLGPDPVTWEVVQALNATGATALSRQVLLDPPSQADVLAYLGSTQLGADEEAGRTVAIAGVVAGLALLEVALLAGPAFAVGARRQRRQLALLAATGAERRQVRDVVLAGGLVTGLLASTVGAALGVAAAAGVRQLALRSQFAYLPRLDVRPLELLAVVAVGTATALAAAAVPALQASHQDVVAALSGRRGQARVRWRVPAVGAVVAGLGTAAAVVGAVTTRSMLVLAGAVLAELGLVATTGAVVAGLARLAPRLPVPGRVALRDAARQRGRTAPAVAAVMTAVAGAVAVSVYVVTQDERNQEAYVASAPMGTAVYTNWENGSPADIAVAAGVVQAHLPVTGTVPLTGLTMHGDPDLQVFVSTDTAPGQECPLDQLDRAPTRAERDTAAEDPRCPAPFSVGSSQAGTALVDDGTTLAVLTGRDDPAGRRALTRGDVLVGSPTDLWPDGTAHLRVERWTAQEAQARTRELVVPARVADLGGFLELVVPPAKAAELGLDTFAVGFAAPTERMPERAEAERAQAALADAGLGGFVYVERGWERDSNLALLSLAAAAAVVALGATLTAVGLSAAESRADLATLAAVGAAPAVRRRIAAAQALVVAATGVGLGVLAGLVLGTVVVLMQRHGPLGLDPTWRLLVPWGQLLAVAVGVPLLAAACGFVFTRSRLPMVRRLGQ